MKIRFALLCMLCLCLLLTGCMRIPPQEETGPSETVPSDTSSGMTAPSVTIPSANGEWGKGESPVPDLRVGIDRGSMICTANGENGVYFMSEDFIYYLDDGSDHLVPLCGRPDCTHKTADCNAYVFEGEQMTVYGDHLYVSSGNRSTQKSELIRMDLDGSNHVTVLNLLDFAIKQGGNIAVCDLFTDKYALIEVRKLEETTTGTMTTATYRFMALYYYAMDGSMDEPQLCKSKGMLKNCGDTVLCLSDDYPEIAELCYCSWDPETDTMTYLMPQPGYAGYCDDEAAYYHKDGAVYKYTHATGTEEVMAETGLEGRYVLNAFPDCFVLGSGYDVMDPDLYIYNWEFQLVDMIELPFASDNVGSYLVSETEDRLIFVTEIGPDPLPAYYLSKSELGTGTAELHPLTVY